MNRAIHDYCIVALLLVLGGCGEEYYATPEKTLNRYVENRMMGTRQEYEATLNSFTKEDREWFEAHYMDICVAAYERDCPGVGIGTETAVWTDFFEPAGPRSTAVESSEIDEANDTAVLTVAGKKFEFVKKNGNWKINGFFGVPEQLAEKYSQLKAKF